jgi:hypothetical protein
MEELPRERAINDQPSNLLIKKRKAILPGTKTWVRLLSSRVCVIYYWLDVDVGCAAVVETVAQAELFQMK